MTLKTFCILRVGLFLLFFLPGLKAAAQYHFERIGLESGLSNEYIWSIAEDSKGIIWLGGINGLEGFDGRQVIDLLQTQHSNASGITFNSISSLHLDPQGAMWVGSQNRIALFSPARKEITLWQEYHKDQEVLSASFSYFHDLANGKILTAIGSRIYRIDRHSPALELVTNADPRQRFIGFFQLNEQVGAILDNWQIYWLDAEGNLLSKHQLPAPDNQQPAGIIMVTQEDQLLIAGANFGLFSAAPDALHSITQIENSENIENILSLGQDQNGDLLIGTQSGLLKGSWKDGGLNTSAISVSDGDTKAQYVYAISTSSDGTLLFGTDRGLFKGQPESNAITHLAMAELVDYADTITIAQDNTRALWGAGNRIWRLDTSGETLPLPEPIRSLADVSHILTNDDEIWVSHRYGIAVIQSQTLALSNIQLAPEAIGCADNDLISAYHGIKLRSRNALAFGVKGGVILLDSETRTPEYIPLGNGCRPFGIVAENVEGHLFTSRSREIWRIDNALHSHVHPVTDSTYLFPFRGNATGLPQIWFNTGPGIRVWLEEAQMLQPVNWLSSDWVSLLETDSDFWVSTLQEGIHRITKSTGEVRFYGKSDGLLNRKYNLNAAIMLNDGRLAFGGEEGIDIINPQTMPGRERLDLQISSLSYDLEGNRQVVLPLMAHIDHNQIVLPANARNIEFWLNSPNHQYAAQYRFRYQMSGLSDSWQTLAQNTSKFTLGMLPVGIYQLSLEVTSPSGATQRLNKPIELRVEEPGWDWWYKKAFAAIADFFNVWVTLTQTAQNKTKIIYLMVAILLLTLLVFWRFRVSKTRQKELEKEVAQKTRFITKQHNELETLLHYRQDLLANIAHELKTPLTLLLGVVTGQYSDAERKNKLERLVFRISRLLDNMLDLSKSQTTPAARYNYRTQEFVEFYITTYRGFVSKERLLVTENEPALIACAPDVLDKIITNLINNAIKYSPSDSTIEIRATNAQSLWQFEVRNQGKGIAAEQLESVFERFVQVDEKRHSYGLGLGLPLVKQLVESIGGTIEIQSVPEQLTRVKVSIPLTEATLETRGVNHDELSEEYRNWLYAEIATKPDVAQNNTEISQHHEYQSLVFCIDDNTELLAQLQAQLGHHYQLHCFEDPVKALQQASQQIPDIIVSDVMMPQLNGFELVQKVRENHLTSHIPVILLTARSDSESEKRGLEALADDYLTKPYQPQQLMARIDNLINIRKLLRTRFTIDTIESQETQDNKATDPNIANNRFQISIEDAAPEQKRFMEKVIGCIQANISEPDFSLTDLGNELHLSDSQIRRKVKAISGYSPQEVLRIIRLETVAAKIREGEALKAIAHDCGFSSQSHMGASFKARFGKTPNQYRAENYQ